MNQIIPIPWSEHCHTKEKRFIINDIICVGFSILENTDDSVISLLFGIHQDLDDKYEYINMNLTLDSPGRDLKAFKASGMYIKDLQKDPNTKLQLQEMTKYLKPNNLYTIDLNINKNTEKNFYIMSGIRSTGKDTAEVQEYQFDYSMYIMLRLFKEFIKNNALTNTIFLDENLKTIESITPLFVKLDGTIIEQIHPIRNRESSFYQITSHYTFTNGPTFIRVNYKFKSPKKIKKALREPMVYEQYKAQFEEDLSIVTTLYEEETDNVLVIIPEFDKHKTIVLRLTKDIYEKTNLNGDLEHYIFYDGVESDSNIVVPHVKF